MLEGKRVMTGKRAGFPQVELKVSYLLLLDHPQPKFRTVRHVFIPVFSRLCLFHHDRVHLFRVQQ